MEDPVSFSGWTSHRDRGALLGDQEPRSGRVYTMYHGTHTRDAPAIISRGFRRSADGLLGAGVYVSRNIRKAECYPLGAHQNDRVVLKLSVRVGRVKRIDRDHHPQQKSWHQDGYDCAWVPPNCGVSAIKSGREEDCVWDPGRIAVVDVARCADERARRELRGLIRARAAPGHACPRCHQDDPAGQHRVERCPACAKAVCPFQSRHKCA
ncbi:GCRV-induced gene 2o [Denticeps clupeoides]|uniref:GCRV-induced gene 2o n=1 Tax=Denticeps clupeoides TaxID=299321 RepID=UPI0010A2C2D6|nr:uncharacterized protein LOC114792494 [Denticeps clupeoides]